MEFQKKPHMKYKYRFFSSLFLIGGTATLSAQTTTFSYTGAVQTYVVPACVSQITVDASGAQGGGPFGGMGGESVATMPVTPGSTLYIFVGGCPVIRPGAGSGGFNGGGQIIAMPCGGGTYDGWGGGGASDVRTTMNITDRIIVAGGGGGTGYSNGVGGNGGGTTGSDGGASWISGTQGFGATQSAGGAGGLYTGNGQSAPSGTLGVGGDAGPVSTYCTGGGGGGGYYGGGGGYVSAGAGGSSYIAFPGSINTSTTAGIRSGNGVVLITPVTSTPAPGAIIGSNPVCAYSSANYSISNVAGATSYTWSVSSGIINSGQGTTSINITPSVTTTISVTATFPCGTSTPSTYTLTVTPSPNVGVNVLPSATVCAGTSVTLNGTNAIIYTWSGGITNGVPFVPSSTTTYTVSGTDGVCSRTTTQTITVNPLPTVTAGSTASAICAGGSVTLTGGGATSYTWDNSVMDGVSFIPASTTTYMVTGTDANTCSNTATLTVTVNPLPAVTASATSTVVCLDDIPVSLTGTPVNGTWTGPGVTGTSFDPMAAGLGTQMLTYSFTDVNTCTNTATVSIDVNVCTGVDQTTIADGVNIFPNPNSGSFILSVNTTIGDLSIEIIDMQGRVVYSSTETNVQSGFSKQISTGNFANGIYMLRLTTSSDQQIKKISVQK
jgi:hypothetical protein